MREPTIQFPVTCPLCGNEALAEYPVAEVADALLAGTRASASPLTLPQSRLARLLSRS